MRSVVSIAVGMLIAVLIVGGATRYSLPLNDDPSTALRSPHAWIAVGYSIIAAAVGGFVCAWIADRAQVQHATVLGVLLVITAIVLMQMQWWRQPRWYQFAMAGCAPLSVLIGAHARLLSKRPATHPVRRSKV